jgi:hypothetical protein
VLRIVARATLPDCLRAFFSWRLGILSHLPRFVDEA